MMTERLLHCPNCYQMDCVQKVSAIVNTGIVSSTYTGFANGVGYTPNGPVFVDNYIALSGRSQTALSSLLSPPIRPSNYKRFSGYLIIFTVILVFLAFLFQSIAPLTGLPPMLIMLYAEYRDLPNKRSQYAVAITNWQRAMDSWGNIYYCHRCDGVFLLGQNYLVPSVRMTDFLYSI